jgi:predicted nucleotidyltransferase component of viral defense system
MTTALLQKTEVFHLTFLRALIRLVPISSLVVKGGTNLRFFFGSIRYSEDMDLDASGLAVHVLREKVMAVLNSSGLVNTLQTFGIERIQPPNISRAKQTETVQRFKVHLFTVAGEDLFTKIEFSRRGLDSPIRSEQVSASILAAYRMAPIIIPHYPAVPAARQKIRSLLSRQQPEARDIFDLYILGSQPELSDANLAEDLTRNELVEAREKIHALEYAQYRDTVVSYLGHDDQAAYDSRQIWDEIRLRVVSLLERANRDGE